MTKRQQHAAAARARAERELAALGIANFQPIGRERGLLLHFTCETLFADDGAPATDDELFILAFLATAPLPLLHEFMDAPPSDLAAIARSEIGSKVPARLLKPLARLVLHSIRKGLFEMEEAA